MSNLFKTAIEAAFTATWLTSVDGGVAVVNGDNTAQGIVSYDTANQIGAQLSSDVTGNVAVLIDDIGDVEIDSQVTVDGTRVFVTNTTEDAAGAILRISFRESRPVPECML